MKTRFFYALSALVMVTMMFVTSCKENNEVQPEPPVQSYSVSFNANGGSGTMQVLRGDEGETITLTANSFTREDYSFSGWNTKTDGTGTSYADKAKVKLSANLTLYAQWIADAATTFEVTFEANGGEGTMESQVVEEGKETALAANSFTREDYSFSGWNTKSDGSGTSYAECTKVTLSANLTLFAQWVESSSTIAVTGITLDKTTLTLEPDEFYDPLVATITPSNATNKKVIWSSSNNDVVYVDNTSGDMMTPGDLGTATITATTEDGGFTATCKVTVEKSAPAFEFDDDARIFIEGVSGANPESYTLEPSSSATLYFARYWDKERYDYPNAKWSSSDLSVVSVSKSQGSEVVIKALKNGTATITATDDKGNELTLDITVKGFEFDDDARIFVEGVSGAAPESYTLKSSSSATLYFARYWDKERYDYPNAKWSSSDPSVVSVSKSQGSEVVIKALKDGAATITATDDKGNELTLDILATTGSGIMPTAFEVLGADENGYLYAPNGKEIEVKYKVTPANADISLLTFEESVSGQNVSLRVNDGKIYITENRLSESRNTFSWNVKAGSTQLGEIALCCNTRFGFAQGNADGSFRRYVNSGNSRFTWNNTDDVQMRAYWADDFITANLPFTAVLNTYYDDCIIPNDEYTITTSDPAITAELHSDGKSIILHRSDPKLHKEVDITYKYGGATWVQSIRVIGEL